MLPLSVWRVLMIFTQPFQNSCVVDRRTEGTTIFDNGSNAQFWATWHIKLVLSPRMSKMSPITAVKLWSSCSSLSAYNKFIPNTPLARNSSLTLVSSCYLVSGSFSINIPCTCSSSKPSRSNNLGLSVFRPESKDVAMLKAKMTSSADRFHYAECEVLNMVIVNFRKKLKPLSIRPRNSLLTTWLRILPLVTAWNDEGYCMLRNPRRQESDITIVSSNWRLLAFVLVVCEEKVLQGTTNFRTSSGSSKAPFHIPAQTSVKGTVVKENSINSGIIAKKIAGEPRRTVAWEKW